MNTWKSFVCRICATLLLLASGAVSAQTVYGLFGLPNPDIGKKQLGTLEPTTGNVALLGSASSIDPGQVATTTGATAVAVDAGLVYFIGRDSTNTDYIYTVDQASGALVTRKTFSAGAPAPISALTASNTMGVWYDEPAQVLYALFIAPGGDREVVSIDPTTGTTVSVSGAVAGEALTTAGGVFTGDSTGQRVFFLGTPASDAAQLYMVSTANGSVTQVPLQDYDESTVQGIEWDSSSDTLWSIVSTGRDGGRALASIDTTSGEVLADFAPLDGGDPIATSSGLIALEKQTQKLFFIGRNSSSQWSIYTVDLGDGSGTSQPIDNSNVQANGYAGIEVVPGPELSLTKDDGGVSAVPGDTVTYTLTASNATGTGTSSQTEIVETVPANTVFNSGASTAGWNCVPDASAGSTCTLALPDLASGDSHAYNFAVDVLDPVSAGTTQISNSATLQAFNALTSATASDVTPVTSAATLTLTKTDGDLTAFPGDTVAYTLTAGNSGNQDASNVVLSETVPANSTFNAGASTSGWSCSPDASAGSSCTLAVGTLSGGTQSGFSFAVTVDNPLAAGATQLSNSASVSADNAVQANASDTTPVTATPSLNVSASDGGITAAPGDTIVYVIAYANIGNQNTADGTITATLPEQTVFDAGASTPGWNCSGSGTVTCALDIGAVAGGGGGGNVSFVVAVNDPVLADTASVSLDVSFDASNASPASGGDSTPIAASPNLALFKSDGDVSSVPGERISYTLIAQNQGDMNASNAVLTETVPAQTQFDAGNSSPGWSCVPDSGPGATCTNDLGTLAGSDFKVRLFAVRVDNPVTPGTTEISNDASLDADNAPAGDVASDTTPLDVRLDLAVAKSDGGVTVLSGQPLGYTLTYANNGTQNASGVQLNETVPDNTTFDSANSSPGWSCADQAPAGTACVLTIGALSAGDTGVATFGVTVDDPLPGGSVTLSNTVTITDDGSAGSEATPADNTATEETPAEQTALDLSITKSGTLDKNTGVIDYTITVTNSGNVTDSSAHLQDALDDPALDSASAAWDCSSSGDADCVATGTGPIDTTVYLGPGGSLSVLLSVPLVPGTPAEEIFNTATIEATTPSDDVNPGNNSATVRVIKCLFCDGFDPPPGG